MGFDIALHFRAEPDRFNALRVETPYALFDFSKQAIHARALQSTINKLISGPLPGHIQALAIGTKINLTERRAATHMQLRDPAKRGTHEPTRVLANRIAKSGVKAIINLGIGGSDLGLRLAHEALRAIGAPMRVELRFCTGLDPAEWAEAKHELSPAATACVVASKSFTTLETLTTGERARKWLGPHAKDSLYATTTSLMKAAEYGIDGDHTAVFDDSVGGRYSLWSAVNLPLRVAYGNDIVDQILAGAHSMDRHFMKAPIHSNAPALAAITRDYNRNTLGFNNQVVVPYVWGLRRLAEYLQQLIMESNGKRVNMTTGEAIHLDPCSSVWGTVGTAAQHAYFQWLHQHPKGAAVDLIATRPTEDPGSRALFENAAAQARALAFGHWPDIGDPLAEHKASPGNRPTTFIALPALTPESLGALLSFYEASVFVEAFIAGINPFDQFGVEYGKLVARQIATGEMGEMDASTKALLAWARD
jgi:glucose-6-phosphate isomerase